MFVIYSSYIIKLIKNQTSVNIWILNPKTLKSIWLSNDLTVRTWWIQVITDRHRQNYIWVLVYFLFLLCFIAWQNYAVLLPVQMYIIFVSSTVMLVVRHFHFIHAQIILLSGSPCTNNPCENGGTCSIVDGFASCACLNNWSGQTCTGNYWTW